MPTICTFNANNLFVRYQFNRTFPGDRTGKSLVEDPKTGYLPVYNPELFELFNETQRELAARVLTNNGKDFPDVICLQEIESLIALRKFNEVYLREKYPFALLIDARDFRQIDSASSRGSKFSTCALILKTSMLTFQGNLRRVRRRNPACSRAIASKSNWRLTKVGCSDSPCLSITSNRNTPTRQQSARNPTSCESGRRKPF
jgi:hypothetical protein